MNFREFNRQLKLFMVFSLRDIRKAFPRFDRRRLFEWQKKGLLLNVRRGYYAFPDHVTREQDLFLIANEIYQPSYVSCESALSYYHLIPESVYGVTSVTSLKSARFHTPFGTLWYRTLRPKFIFGYSLIPYPNRPLKIAEPEKALADLLYLRRDLATKEDFAELRLSRNELRGRWDTKKFLSYLAGFRNQKLERRGNILLSTYRI